MKAVVVVADQAGGSLHLANIDEPRISPTQLLVAVRAAALNRADLSQRAGRYRQEATTGAGPVTVAGLEFAGEVIATGKDVKGFSPGDRVMTMGSGGYAERASVDYRIALPVPDRLSWPEAAAVPVGFMTEHDALIAAGRFRPGDAVLFTAASAAVATAGLQIARRLGAAMIFGTVAIDSHRDRVRQLGADVVLGADDDVVGAVLAETAGRGVDLIIDHVGGPDLARNLAALAVGGRLVSVGRLGPTVGPIDLDLVARQRLTIIGVSFRSRSIEEYAAVAQAMWADLGTGLADGSLAPVCDRVFPLAEADQAQAYMEQNRHFGKIVLSVP